LVVVIDPGHGGKDTGAAVGKAMEKDIVLDLALRLGESIQKNILILK
jgi:N-acetylmuramoyl-L-alanine amidase